MVATESCWHQQPDQPLNASRSNFGDPNNAGVTLATGMRHISMLLYTFLL